jgi:hypothetical protein
MSLDVASPVTTKPALPVDAHPLPDPATLSCRLHGALDQAALAGFDVELHLDTSVPLPGPQAKVLACAQESAVVRGIALHVVG